MILQTVFLFSNSEIYCAPIQKNSKSKSSVKSIQNTMPIYNDGIVNITLEAIPINIGPKGAEDWGLNKYKNTALGSGGEAKFVIHTEGLSSGAEIIFPLLITLYDMVGSNDNKPEEFSANVATPGVGYRFVGGIRKELTNPKNIVFLELKDGVEIKVKDLKSPDNVDAPLRGADVNVIADLLLDLRIYNGGGDLDNGENLSGNSGYDPSIPLNEDKEEFEGACVLVNWDNDNKFGVNFNNLNRIDNPKPDLSKSTKTNNEDNLTKIDLIIHPFLKKVGGQIKIAVTKGADKIKFWKNKDKSGGSANGWINKKFSVNDPKLPSSIWIEGVKKSASQKDIEIQLQYTGILGNLKDVVKLTCVMIRLGNAAYRDLNLTGTQHFGHAALTYRYNSKAHLFDLLNADNFDIMEMMNGVPALQVNQLSSLINLGPWGCFTNAQYLPDNDAGYKNRLIVLA
ncbi:MAG TPA: hypothetical protein PLQ81_05175, partial [bacterium]|nr:hypothetical protein [bacterium]